MTDLINPFEWTPTFSDFKKNIIEDDIIPDELLQGIQNKIKNHCLSNYQNYKPSGNVGYSLECNDSGGTSSCNCDISGVNCYPANCTGDCSGVCACKTASVYTSTDQCKKDICNSYSCSTYTGP